MILSRQGRSIVSKWDYPGRTYVNPDRTPRPKPRKRKTRLPGPNRSQWERACANPYFPGPYFNPEYCAALAGMSPDERHRRLLGEWLAPSDRLE